MFSIGRLAAEAGIAASAVRYYEREGVLRKPDRIGPSRVYGRADLERVNAVVAARELGFTIRELRALAGGIDTADRQALRLAVSRKVDNLDGKIRRLTAARDTLAPLMGCACASPATCTWTANHPL